MNMTHIMTRPEVYVNDLLRTKLIDMPHKAAEAVTDGRPISEDDSLLTQLYMALNFVYARDSIIREIAKNRQLLAGRVEQRKHLPLYTAKYVMCAAFIVAFILIVASEFTNALIHGVAAALCLYIIASSIVIVSYGWKSNAEDCADLTAAVKYYEGALSLLKLSPQYQSIHWRLFDESRCNHTSIFATICQVQRGEKPDLSPDNTFLV